MRELVLMLGALFFLGCAGYVALSYVTAFAAQPRVWLRPAIWRAAFVEMLVAWIVVPLWPLWWVLGAVYKASVEGEGEARGRRNPVVLLHGFGMNRTQWFFLARRLRAKGHGPIYGMNYFSLHSVARSAKHLGRFVEHVMRCEQADAVDIVAHSLGGIVARYYVERLSGSRKIGRLITIGTPHKGTRIGHAGFAIPSARDLLTGSPLLTDLGPVRAGADYTSIWSRADAVVQPPESASIAPAGTDQVFDDLGHLSLVVSPRVIDVIDARLRR
jgi:pimeloyl-ACP methyl ester carboxylesterase